MEDKQQIQDKELQDLFKSFQPHLTSEDKFLKNLDKSLQAVDIVKELSHSQKRKNYIALAVAFVVGAIMGVALALLFPLLGELTTPLTITLPDISVNVKPIVIDWRIFGWLLIAVTCILTAKNAYDITLYKLNTAKATSR